MTTRSRDAASPAVSSALPSSTRRIVSTTAGGIHAMVSSRDLAALYAGITTTVRNVSIEPRPLTPERRCCAVSGNCFHPDSPHPHGVGAFDLFQRWIIPPGDGVPKPRRYSAAPVSTGL